MDWGLLRRDPRAPFGWSMREQLLITPNKAVYGMLCVFNLCLRFVWALSLFGIASSPGGGMFFLESVEILRRTVWAIFRIEVRARDRMNAALPPHVSQFRARAVRTLPPLR